MSGARHLLLGFIWKDGRIDNYITDRVVQDLIEHAVQHCYGVLGAGLASLVVRYFHPLTNLCILRCERESCQEVIASIGTITQYQSRPLEVRLLKIGGRLRDVKPIAFEHTKAALLAQSAAQSANWAQRTRFAQFQTAEVQEARRAQTTKAARKAEAQRVEASQTAKKSFRYLPAH